MADPSAHQSLVAMLRLWVQRAEERADAAAAELVSIERELRDAKRQLEKAEYDCALYDTAGNQFALSRALRAFNESKHVELPA
jgi:hypothetical protein